MGNLNNPTRYAWQYSLETLDMNPPTLNTLHEVFHHTQGCVIYVVAVQQDNTPLNAEEIDVLLTIDGDTTLFDSSVVNTLNSGTSYTFFTDVRNALLTDIENTFGESAGFHPIVDFEQTAPYRGTSLKGHDCRLQVRQTSAIAAGARIRAMSYVETLVRVG